MTHSWEIGTLAEALTEHEWSWLGVFAPGSIPPPSSLGEDEAADVLCIAEKCVLFLAFRFPHHGIGWFLLMPLAGGYIQSRCAKAT
jgi:hypothetical protein